MAKGDYFFRTRIGVFWIAFNGSRWHAWFDGQSLGAYSNPAGAADDLAGGHTFTPSCGVDTSTLGIPGDLSEWERQR